MQNSPIKAFLHVATGGFSSIKNHVPGDPVLPCGSVEAAPRQHLAVVYTLHCVSQVPEDVPFHLGSAVGANEDTSLPVPEEALADEAALHGAGQCHGLLVLLQLLLQ